MSHGEKTCMKFSPVSNGFVLGLYQVGCGHSWLTSTWVTWALSWSTSLGALKESGVLFRCLRDMGRQTGDVVGMARITGARTEATGYCRRRTGICGCRKQILGHQVFSIVLILEQLILKFHCTDCSSASYLEVIQNKSQMSSHISPWDRPQHLRVRNLFYLCNP